MLSDRAEMYTSPLQFLMRKTKLRLFKAQFIIILIDPKSAIKPRAMTTGFGPIKIETNLAQKVGLAVCSSSSSLKTVMEKYTFQPDPIKFALVTDLNVPENETICRQKCQLYANISLNFT